MQKFKEIRTTVVPLLIDNIDTDQIIPARFLKTTVKTGIGENVFRDWRFDENNQKIDSFILNHEGEDGKILLAGENFGCGSSREHAVWALYDYGFRAVVAKSFADIFKQNSLNNGLLPIAVSDEFWLAMKEASKKDNKTLVSVDLQNQTISINDVESETFEIDEFRKECILKGYTDLDYLVSIHDEINSFETSHPVPSIKF